MRRARGLALVAAPLLGLSGGGLAAQEAQEAPPVVRDTAAQPGTPAPETRPRRQGCPLVLEQATTLNRIQRAGAYVYHFGGGMLWRCGNADMVADSAIRYEATARVEMMGNVEYRDTIRTLESDFLTYYELPDLVVATGDVHLTRLSTGSTVDGPRIEFLRSVSGRGEEVTSATGRPHLVLYPSGRRERPPFEVDADVTILAGEEMARARGDVLIRRPDLLARADSAVFDIVEGGGVLYGSPEVEGRGFRLSGDTIRLSFEEEELREVWARGRAYAAGETFEVMADEIRARIEEEKAREVWAYGADRSLAVSAPYRVFGDSLRFVLTAGSIDSVVAVGGATAVELPEAEESGAPGTGERLAAGGAREPPAAEAEEAPSDPERGGALEDRPQPGVALEGRPQRGGALEDRPQPVPLPAPAGVVDSADVRTSPDATGAPLPSEAKAVPRDTAAATVDTATVRRVGRARPAGVPPPRLSVEGSTSWMAGDTLFAIFGPAAADSVDVPTTDEGEERPRVGEADPEGAAVEEPERAVEEPERAAEQAGPPDSAAAAPSDSAGRELERIRVIGVQTPARAYYAAITDSSRSMQPSRNYLIGKEIEIQFREGRAFRVRAERAIGVHLDPEEEPGGGGPEAPGAADTTTVPPDTASAPPDTTRVPADTASAPADTAPAMRETAGARRGGTATTGGRTVPGGPGTARGRGREPAWRRAGSR